jgi:nitroreductase
MTKHMTHPTERPLSALDVIFTRRSVRSYTGQKVDAATIRSLLDAAVQAPTAMHAEQWLFVVIQNDTVLKRYSDLAKAACIAEAEHFPELHDPHFSMFYNAGTLVVIYGRAEGRFAAADCWLASQNLMLAACALGLGTCLIGSAVSTLDSPEAKSEFGLPAGAIAVAPIIVGIPSGEVAEGSPRQEPQITYWK